MSLRSLGGNSPAPVSAGTGTNLMRPVNNNISVAARRRVRLACDACRLRKSRCDGASPRCGACCNRSTDCVYLPWKARASVTREYAQVLKERNRELERKLRAALGYDEPSDEPSPSVNELLPNRQDKVHAYMTPEATTATVTSPRDSKDSSNNDQDMSEASTAPRDPAGGPSIYLRDSASSNMNEVIELTISNHPSLGTPPDDPHDDPPVGWVEDDILNDGDTEPDEPDEMTPRAGYFGDSSIYAFISTVRTSHAVSKASPPASNRLKHREISNAPTTLVQQLYRVQNGIVHLNDCLALPRRALADRLVDAYFLYVHSLLPFIHEPTFRANYERTWRSGPEGIGNYRLSWLGVLNLIFAYGCEFVDMPPDRAQAAASRFFSRAKVIVFSEVFRSGNLEILQTLLLMSHYLQSTNELNKCWSVVGLFIRMAQGMGLHLEPSRWNVSPIEREIRRRLWWGGFVVDRTLGLKYGRPPSSGSDETIHVELPTPIDDDYLRNDITDPQQPPEQPSKTHFFIACIGLARHLESIIRELYLGGQMDEHSHSTCRPGCPNRCSGPGATFGDRDITYEQGRLLSAAVRLHGELLAWEDTLPSHLKSDAVIDDWQLQRQRNIIYSKFLNARLVLHRQPFLLFCRKKVEDVCLRSIAISCGRQCLSDSRELILLMHKLHRPKMVNLWWYNAHYVFTALCVLVSLDALDKERRVLVAGDNENDDEEMIRRGTELLIEMSMYNSIATRYTQSLEQLRKETRASASGGSNGCSSAEPAVGSVQAAFEAAPNPLFAQGCSASCQGKTSRPSRMSSRSDGPGPWGTMDSGADYRSPWQGGVESGSRTAATDMFNPGEGYSLQDAFSPGDWLSASWLGGNIALDQLPYQAGTMPMNGLFTDDPMLSDFNLANLNLVL